MLMLQAGTTPTDPRVDLVAACVFTVMSVGFAYFGFRILKNPEPIARLFSSVGSRAFGSRTARRVYTASNLRVAGVGFVILGPLFFVLGVFTIWQKALSVFG